MNTTATALKNEGALPATATAADHNFSVNSLLLGGLSILTCIAFWAFVDKSVSVYTVSKLAATLALVCNHPHFMASYVLLYSDFRKNINLGNLRWVWAAVVVPILLGAYLIYCLTAVRSDLLGHSINAMFFLVGWHYVKQIFGVIIVTSAIKRMYYTALERRLFLANLFSIWGISFFNSQTYLGSFDFYGIKYDSMGFSTILLNISFISFYITSALLVVAHFRKYIITGQLPTLPAVVGLVSLYVWYLPVFSHPHFAYLIPFFHSLQYLVFVWSFKKNQVHSQIEKMEPREQRLNWVKKFIGFAVTSLILGLLAFELVPKGLDSYGLIPSNPALGTSPVLVVFLLFINIHHYFIDNVIWKSSNNEVKKHLFAH